MTAVTTGTLLMVNSTLPTYNIRSFTEETIQYCLQYVYLGAAILVAGYIQMVCWLTACERQIFKIRKEFFYAILRQDIGWFDKNQSGALTTKLAE